MNAPSRGDFASQTTNRYVGCFFAPIRRRRIFTMMFSVCLSNVEVPASETGPASRHPSVSSCVREASNCFTKRLTSETCVPLPAAMRLRREPLRISRTRALAHGHRADDRLDLARGRPRRSRRSGSAFESPGDHLHDVVHRAHLAHLAQLVEEVVERKVVLAQFLREILRLLFGIDALRLLDQREHVAHPEDARGEAVGIERFERAELLADADELDRRAGDRCGSRAPRRRARRRPSW